jgi:Tol biopolymer transport system component
MTRPVRPGKPRARDPYGVGPVGDWLAPALSAIGLVIVAVFTFNLLQGDLPIGLGGTSNGDGTGNESPVDPGRTPAPSNVVVIPEEAEEALKGSIVYAKGGNIWVQTADGATQLTDSGDDSMPSWSADGAWVYFIRTVREEGRWRTSAGTESYALDVPRLMRVAAGGGKPETLKTARIRDGRLRYAYWIRQPASSPDGKTVAVISDAPNPDDKTPVLQFFDMASEKLRDPKLAVNGVFGHQDPEWRPDGKFLLYVMNGRDASRGAPQIMRYNVESKKARALTGPGYLYPAYSPDGRYVAATLTSAFGTDVVILDGSTGEQLARITDDGASWAPTWSPAGDAIAYLNLDGQTVDLRLATLEGSAPSWTVGETTNLTEVSGLEAASRPDWFIPADQLPATPPPSAAPSPTPAT